MADRRLIDDFWRACASVALGLLVALLAAGLWGWSPPEIIIRSIIWITPIIFLVPLLTYRSGNRNRAIVHSMGAAVGWLAFLGVFSIFPEPIQGLFGVLGSVVGFLLAAALAGLMIYIGLAASDKVWARTHAVEPPSGQNGQRG